MDIGAHLSRLCAHRARTRFLGTATRRIARTRARMRWTPAGTRQAQSVPPIRLQAGFISWRRRAPRYSAANLASSPAPTPTSPQPPTATAARSGRGPPCQVPANIACTAAKRLAMLGCSTSRTRALTPSACSRLAQSPAIPASRQPRQAAPLRSL